MTHRCPASPGARCRPRFVPVTVAAAAATLLAACATPAARLDSEAARHGYVRAVLAGTDFRHVTYAKGLPAAGGTLNVYIEGDGSPYVDRWTVNADPTATRPLMLRLMALDAGAALYVGRPCYIGLAADPPCTPFDWTLDRFSERVVGSMAAVIEQARLASGASRLHLFGHSGGATLAVLLARRLPEARCVITLAGNLDTDAWADHHAYTRLRGSLNPVALGPLPSLVEQAHFAGAGDRVLPPELVEQAARRLGADQVFVLAGVSHVRGWEKQWPAILAGHCNGRAAADQRNAKRMPAVTSP